MGASLRMHECTNARMHFLHWCLGAFLHFSGLSCICSEANAVYWRESCTRSKVTPRRLKARRRRLTHMRLCALLFTAILMARPSAAQSSSEDQPRDSAPKLPVSVDKIREALETTPAISLRSLD